MTTWINVNISLFILVTIRYFSLLCPILTNGQHDLDIKKDEKKYIILASKINWVVQQQAYTTHHLLHHTIDHTATQHY